MDETVYGDFKDFDGVKCFTKFITYRDGKKIMESEVVKTQLLERLPVGTFNKP